MVEKFHLNQTKQKKKGEKSFTAGCPAVLFWPANPGQHRINDEAGPEQRPLVDIYFLSFFCLTPAFAGCVLLL